MPSCRNLFRVGLICTVWLLVGAALVFGITWMAIVNSPGETWSISVPEDNPKPGFAWPHAVPQAWSGTAHRRWQTRSRWFDREDFYAYVPLASDPSFGVRMEVYREGRPFRCLGYWVTNEFGRRGDVTQTHGAWLVNFPFVRAKPLPLVPLWSGFAFASLLYGGVAFGLFRVARTVRRLVRLRIGRCVRCGRRVDERCRASSCRPPSIRTRLRARFPAIAALAVGAFLTTVVAWSDAALSPPPQKMSYSRVATRWIDCWGPVSGWPLPAMHGWHEQASDSNVVFERFLFSPGTVGSTKIELPLYPLWPGFALNTIFYAALAWGLWWGVWRVSLAIRRRRRRARGECVRCGYAMAGLASGSPCPECGPSAGS